MNTTDLIHAHSIPSAVKIMREIAQRYREDAERIAADWSDKNAGKQWTLLANDLDRTADKAQSRWLKL